MNVCTLWLIMLYFVVSNWSCMLEWQPPGGLVWVTLVTHTDCLIVLLLNQRGENFIISRTILKNSKAPDCWHKASCVLKNYRYCVPQYKLYWPRQPYAWDLCFALLVTVYVWGQFVYINGWREENCWELFRLVCVITIALLPVWSREMYLVYSVCKA